MKKFLAVLAVSALVAGAVWAQDAYADAPAATPVATSASAAKAASNHKITFTADVVGDVFYLKSNTEDAADKDKNSGKEKDTQFNMFATHKFDDSELRLAYNYTGDNVSAYFRIKMDTVITNGFQAADLNVFEALSSSFDEYSVKGKMGFLSAALTNVASDGRGIFHPYRYALDDFLAAKMNPLGVQKVAITGAITNWEVASLVKSTKNTDGTAIMLGANLGPAIVTFSGLMDSGSSLGNPDAANTAGGNFGARVELAKVADVVSIEALYKAGFYDISNVNSAPNDGETNGDGIINHALGVYANIAPMDGLGITVGYSGLLTTQEKNSVADTTTAHPLFSGIDLRVAFTGVDKLSVYFNNNVSFAGAKGDGDSKKTTLGVDGTTSLGDKIGQSTFALTNSLGVLYKVTDALEASLLLGNRLGSFTVDTDGDKDVMTRDIIGAYAGVTYAPNKNVSVRGGLDLKLTTDEYKPNSGTGSKTGTFEFGIPVGVKFTI